MRLIDADKLFPDVMKVDGSMAISQGQLARAKTVEAIPKADYETRLKADMVAMLTEIQSEIREYHEIGCDEDCNNCCMVGCVEPVNVIKDLDIIQQKIDALKEDK